MAKATANGFIGRVGAVGNSTSYQSAGKVGSAAQRLKVFTRLSHGGRMARATLLALTGAAVGAASKAYSVSQVDVGPSTGQAGINGLGGKRTAVLKTKQSGNTVAQDLTDFDANVAAKSRPSTYPKDKSGWTPGNIGKL